MLHAADALQVIAQLVIGCGTAVAAAVKQQLLKLIKCVGGRIDLRVAEKDMSIAVGVQPEPETLVELDIGALKYAEVRERL